MKYVDKQPQLAGNFQNCPIPFRFDTYTGCSFGCKYCFAREIIEHMREITKGEEKKFYEIRGANPDTLERWIVNTMKNNSVNASKVAFQERIPLKIGTMSDPFPYIERKELITFEILKILEKYDYPVSISTKNPSILADYFKYFNNPNWVLAVTITSFDEGFRKAIEPGAPSIQERLNAISSLCGQGAKVIVRLQPVIYPYIIDKLPILIKIIADSGAFGIVMEGLKVGVASSNIEKSMWKEMSDYIGYDIREWYKTNATRNGSDYELNTMQKFEYIKISQKLGLKYGLKIFIGDNDMRMHSCNGECCGTSCLRNHKILYNSEKIMKCKCSNARSKNLREHTIEEILKVKIESNKQIV